MSIDNLNKWLTLVANIGVVAGIIFLAIELRQNSKSTELQAAQSYMSISHELDFRIVDDPSLIALFLKSPEDRTAEDSFRMERWSFGVFRTWQNGYYLYLKEVLDEELWSGQEVFMSDLLRRNDELRIYYQTHPEYFSKGFTEYLDGLLEENHE